MEPRPEYPRPSLRRAEWQTLNGEWDFGAGPTQTFNRTIVVPFCAESTLSGVGDLPGDTVWYRRRFEAPAAESVILHFGAVDYRATVWVNEVEVIRHEGGHTPFAADITAALRGRDNVLVVRAEDPLADRTIPRGKQFWKEVPEGIFYTPTTGIWQSVWLEPLRANHIRGLRLKPDLESGTVDFEVDADGHVELVATLHGEVVGRWSGQGRAGRIRLDHVVAWRPGSPVLYELQATLFDRDGAIVDRVDGYFGMRTVEAREGKFFLNGEPFIQRLVLDQGYFPGGLLTAPSDEALRADIELAQSLGFNGARKHQKVEDPRWLHWADRLGFLCWSEMPSFHEYSEDAERRLIAEWGDVVRLHRDRPSVVAWVPANESFGLDQVEAGVRSSLLVRLRQLTHELDGGRPAVSNDGWEHAVTDLLTLHDYSKPADLADHFRTVETALSARCSDHDAYSPGFGYRGEPLLVTEFGGVRLSGESGWGYTDARDPGALLDTYTKLIDALMGPGPVQGFCYTQLTDVEQETNGLLTHDRVPKVEPVLIRAVTEKPKG